MGIGVIVSWVGALLGVGVGAAFAGAKGNGQTRQWNRDDWLSCGMFNSSYEALLRPLSAQWWIHEIDAALSANKSSVILNVEIGVAVLI
jgi:hypothetical protein